MKVSNILLMLSYLAALVFVFRFLKARREKKKLEDKICLFRSAEGLRYSDYCLAYRNSLLYMEISGLIVFVFTLIYLLYE